MGVDDAELYRRGMETLVASWSEYARGSPGATVLHLPGVAVAVFPGEPERKIYNNALLERADALGAMEAAYTAAAVTRFSVWVDERDSETRAALEQGSYTLDTSTRAMGMELTDTRLPRPQIELGAPVWSEYLRIVGLPLNLLSRADRDAYRILIARLDGENAAASMAFVHDGDCGIYNTATLGPFRRRGLATALTALHAYDARDRGCRTASLQSTEMAERVYSTVGFRDLGRILEYVPG